MKTSPGVSKQFQPDPRESDQTGLKNPALSATINTNIPGLKRLYLDRVALLITGQCFAKCRFCFRRHYQNQDFCIGTGTLRVPEKSTHTLCVPEKSTHTLRVPEKSTHTLRVPSNSFSQALNYINQDPRIREVLITGGDPFTEYKTVVKLCQQLRKISHLTAIRIGTRIFSIKPELVDEEWIKPFREFNSTELSNYQIIKLSKNHPSHKNNSKIRKFDNSKLAPPISISPHINHPDELTPETIRAILLCTQNNIPLYSQSVLLKDINDDPEVLIDLFRQLRQLGVEPYRLYHCDPVQGAMHFRTSLDKFMEIKRYLRSHASGRINPEFIVDTHIGKVELGADSEIVKREDNICHIKTPYKTEHFQVIDPNWQLPDTCYLAEDGRIVVEYLDS